MSTKQNGILKIELMLLIVICSLFFTTACTSCLPIFVNTCVPNTMRLNDWGYKLPNGYEVARYNSQKVKIIWEDSNGLIDSVIENYVTAFCYNDSYVGIQRVPTFESGEEHSEESIVECYVLEDNTAKIDLDKLYSMEKEYYLLNTDTGEIFGPYGGEEYNATCTQFNVENMGEWISTRTMPEGAYY